MKSGSEGLPGMDGVKIWAVKVRLKNQNFLLSWVSKQGHSFFKAFQY